MFSGELTFSTVIVFFCSGWYGREERQEPALRSIVEDMGRLKVADGSGRYVAGASQSCGMIGRAIQSVSGQTRVLLSLEEAWGRNIPFGHPLMCYLTECAGALRGRDGWKDERAEQRKESDNPCHWHRRGGVVEEQEGWRST